MIKIDKNIVNVFIKMFEDAGRPLKLPEIHEYLKNHRVKILPSDVKKVLHFLERYKVIAISSPMTGFVTSEGYESYIYTPHHYVKYLKKRIQEALPQALQNVEFVLKCNNCNNYIFDYTVTGCPVCGSQNLSFVPKEELLKLAERVDFSEFYNLLFIEVESGFSGVVQYLLTNKA